MEVENYSVLKSHYLSGGAHGQGRAGGAEHCFGRLGTVHVHGARDDQAGLTTATCFTTNTIRTSFIYYTYLENRFAFSIILTHSTPSARSEISLLRYYCKTGIGGI